MTLPVFPVVGNLNKILSVPAADGTLPTVAWSDAQVRFSHNMIDGVLEFQDKIYDLPDPVVASIDANGNIVSVYGRPITLLANDPSLNVEGIQWSAVITSGNRTTTWWFDAPAAGVEINLDDFVPVPGTSVVGLTRGLTGIGGTAIENGDGTISFASGAKAVSSADAAKARQVIGALSQTEISALIATAVNNLLNGAPGALNTLKELADALGDDANFAATVANSLALKAPLASPTFTGTVSGITKSMVGLANVDNTSDTNKPVSIAQAAADAIVQATAVAAQATADTKATRYQLPWPSNLVALWDFQGDTAGGTTLTSKVGSTNHVLTALQGKTVVKSSGDPGPFGSSLVLDGATAFAEGPGIGSLDVAQVGDQVTVIAWVNDTAGHDTGSVGYGFRAGSHCESTTPARQYGLYFDAWGWVFSSGHLGPHIGAQDGPSTGYPFNRDQAISKRCYFTGTGQNQWHMEAMTFDGQQIIAYVDGITDIWNNAAEPPSSYFGAYSDSTYRSAVVNRNPMPFRKGMNRSSTPKYFTIGGAMSNSNAGINFTTGKLGGVAVFNRALTAAEIMQVRMMTLKSNEPITKFALEVNKTGVNSLSETAWFGRASALCADVGLLTAAGSEYAVNRPAGGSTSYLTKTSSGIGAAWVALTGLNSSQVRKVTFDMLSAAATSAAQRLLVKVGAQWWASNTTYATASTHASDTDWSGAETKTVDINWDAGNWLPVTLQDSTTPTAQTFTNIVNNPELSTNATNWFKSSSAANATAARTAVTGGFAYILTWTGTDSYSVQLGGVSQAGVGAITAGQNYCISMQVTSSKAQHLQMEVMWYNAGSTYLSSTFGGVVTCPAAAASILKALGVAPATATQAIVRVVGGAGGTNWASGDTLALTKCLVVQSSLLPAYFDGDTSGAAWTGTAGASTSTLSTTGLPVATNLATNPILKADATGWFTSGSMAHATGARVLSGSEYVWRSTWTGTDATNGASVAGCLNTSIGAITAGQSYTASMKATGNRAHRGWLEIDWYNASNALVSSTVGGTAVCGKNFATTITATGVAPATATQMLVRFIASGWDFVSGDTLDLGSLMVVLGTSLPGVTVEGSDTYTGGTLSLGGSPNTAWVDNDVITAIGFLSSGGDGSAVRVSNLALYPIGNGS